jgi:hypothetical protein
MQAAVSAVVLPWLQAQIHLQRTWSKLSCVVMDERRPSKSSSSISSSFTASLTYVQQQQRQQHMWVAVA